MDSKARKLAPIERSMREMAARLQVLCADIPENFDFDPDNHPPQVVAKVLTAVESIQAIEQEWIVDPDLREELSVIQIEHG